MSTWPLAVQWIALFPLLAIHVTGFTVLQGVVRRSDWKKSAICVPVSGVLVLAAVAYGLAETGAYCAFCG